MAHCQNCGAPSAPTAVVCTECGAKLTSVPRLGSQTIVGVSPFAPPEKKDEPQSDSPADETPAAGNDPLKGTKIGMPSPFASVEKPVEETKRVDPSAGGQPQPEVPRKAFSGTMVGMPSPVAKPLAQGTAAATDDRADNPRAGEAAHAPPKTLSGTMVGMPSPFPASPEKRSADDNAPKPAQAPEDESHPARLDPTLEELRETYAHNNLHDTIGQTPKSRGARPAAAPSASKEASASSAQGQRFSGTLLGIAQPGIAPVHNASAMSPPHPLAPTGTGSGSSHPPSGFSELPSLAPPLGRPTWQTALLVALGLVAAAGIGGLAAKMSKPDRVVTVSRFAVDDSGKDQLELACQSCEDGTMLEIGTASTRFEKGIGTIVVDHPLALGQNEFPLKMVGPEGKELSAAPLIVPVAFRMSSNWKGRHAETPHGEVLVEAPAESTIKIDGKAVMAIDGKVSYEVPVDEQTLGESSEIEKVAIDVPIEVTTGGKSRTTRASLRGAITPLTLSSVGPIHEIGKGPVTIAGRSAAGAKVSADGKNSIASEDGTFSLVLEDPKEFDGFVTAFTDELLARRVPLVLTRSAEEPEDTLRTFSAIDKAAFVHLTGTVIESRVSQGVTRTLIEVDEGCKIPPCLISASYAEPRHLTPNRSVTVFGWAQPGDPLTLEVIKFPK